MAVNEPPTITDVRLSGSSWTGLDAYSFSSIVAAGEQFRPIFTEGVNTLEIEFSEHVLMDGGELDLKRTERDEFGVVSTASVTPTDFVYDVGEHVATWTFGALGDGKYAIHLDASITDVGLNLLDADWTNDHAGTPDIFGDDPTKSFAADLGNGMAGTEGSEFRFHFALLAGDYDGDGIVEAMETGGNGDGNGDGMVDINDNNIGTVDDMLPLRTIGGADLNDDEIVDAIDLAIWQTGYGGTTVADVDGDGDFDVDDILLWQQVNGYYTAWYTGPHFAGTGGTVPPVLMGPAPQVMNVTISGSVSLHDPYEFDSVVGSGLQLQTVPVGGADTISITFSELVNISADSLAIVGLQSANVPVLAEFSYDAMTMTATWRFESWVLGDRYLLSLHDSVTDIEGNLLDGEWVNPQSISTVNSLVSEFPSGDGTAGGHFNFVMTLLPGDADLDGDVDIDDFNELGFNFLNGEGNLLFTDADFNGDGVVDIHDFNILGFNYETVLQNLLVQADLDNDFVVDGNDLQTISDNYGMTDPKYDDGDLNDDGTIDDADLDLAFAQFSLAFDGVA